MQGSYLALLLLICLTKSEGSTKVIRKGILVLVILAIVTEIASKVSANYFNSTALVEHFYEITYPLTTMLIFWQLFEMPHERRRVIWSILLFLVVSFAVLLIDGYDEINPIRNVIGQFFIMGFSVEYLFKLFQNATVPRLKYHLPFWFVAGMLLYNATTFFVVLFERVIRVEDTVLFYSVWQIQLYVSILFNLILAKGIWETRRRSS